MKRFLLFTSILFLCITNQAFAQNMGGQLFGGGVQMDIYRDNLQDRQLFVNTFLSNSANSGAKTIRMVFINLDQEHAGNDPASYTQAQYQSWFDTVVLPGLAEYVPFFLNNGVEQVLISIQTPYMGRQTNVSPPVDNLFKVGNEAAAQFMIGLWTQIATLYNQYPQVVYQMFSEPIPPNDNKEAYSNYQQDFINAVRGATPAIDVNSQPTIAVMPYAGNLDKTKSIKHEYMTGRGAVAFNFYGHVQKIWRYTHQGSASATDSDVLDWPGCTNLSAEAFTVSNSKKKAKKKKLKEKKKAQKKKQKKLKKATKKLQKKLDKLQAKVDEGTATEEEIAKLAKLTEKKEKLDQKIEKIQDKIDSITDKISDLKGGGGGGEEDSGTDPCTREGLAEGLADIVAFAAQIGWKLLVPEFSVSRFAPSATVFLNDVFQVMDDLNIDVHYFNLSEVSDSAWRLDCNTTDPEGQDPLGSACNVGENQSPRLDMVKSWLGLAE